MLTPIWVYCYTVKAINKICLKLVLLTITPYFIGFSELQYRKRNHFICQRLVVNSEKF